MKATWSFVVMAVKRISFRAGISKNKKYRSTRLRMIISLFYDSTLSNVLDCCHLFYCNQKEKDIRRKINSKNKNIDAWNLNYYCDLLKIRVS